MPATENSNCVPATHALIVPICNSHLKLCRVRKHCLHAGDDTALSTTSLCPAQPSWDSDRRTEAILSASGSRRPGTTSLELGPTTRDHVNVSASGQREELRISDMIAVNLLDCTPGLAVKDDRIQVTCWSTIVVRAGRRESRRSKSYDEGNVYLQSTRSVMRRKEAQECAKMRGYEEWDGRAEGCCRKSTAVCGSN